MSDHIVMKPTSSPTLRPGTKVRCTRTGEIGVVREVMEVWSGPMRLKDAVFIDTSASAGIIRDVDSVEPIGEAR